MSATQPRRAPRARRRASPAPDRAASEPARCRLYLITPPSFDPQAFAPRLEEALDAGEVACVQLRLKEAADEAVLKAARILMPLCHRREVAFLVNDRADLAARAGADGVHIGAEDVPYERARALVGQDAIVGVSCYDSRHAAMVAAEAGADYVAFGAFFPTATKRPPAHSGLDLLRWWSELSVVPCVAIGGITPENCGPLVAAGADFLAVVSAVWERAQGPGAAVRAFEEAIERALKLS